MRYYFKTLLLTISLASCVFAQSTNDTARPPRHPAQVDLNKFALIVNGASGEEAYANQFQAWTSQLAAVLTERYGFPNKQIHILCEKPANESQQPATAVGVRQTITALKTEMSAESALFVFFIGHGSFDGKEAKFNLVGPDLSSVEYNTLLSSLPSKRIVIFNMASASGEFIKGLSAKGRVIVTATRNGQESNATHFAGFLLTALNADDVDMDQDGHVSVLEAFTYASRLTSDFYTRAGRLATEHPLLDDNGDGLGREKADAVEGGLARATYIDSLNIAEAAANAATLKLMRDRARLESEIEGLIGRKSSLSEAEYEAQLEKLFIELAKINRSIKQAGS